LQDKRRTERYKRAISGIKVAKHAYYRRNQETDCPAAQAVLQNMLQVRWQEPDLVIEVPQVPRQPDEAKEQDAWSQKVSKRLSALFVFA
jgi:hypothetical protein